jgi:hypothetical protein
MKKCASVFLAVIFLAFGAQGETSLKVKVIVEKAKVRAARSLTSTVIMVASRGEVFSVLDKTEQWYKIRLPQNHRNDPASGYVLQTIVSEVQEANQMSADTYNPSGKIKAKNKPRATDYYGESRSGNSPDLNAMLDLEKKVRMESLAFLSLVNKMKPEKITGTKMKSLEMVKVNRRRCQVFEADDESSRVIYNPNINEEFEVLAQNDNFIQIKLADNRKGWLLENFVQSFAIEKKETIVKFQGVSQSEIKDFIAVASAIFSRLTEHKALADRIFEKFDVAVSGRDANFRKIAAVQDRIGEFYRNAQYFFSHFIEGNGILFTSDVTLLSRLSLWTELLLGTSVYKTKPADLSADSSGGNGTHAFGLGGNLALNKNSQVSFSLASKKDVIQTPYTSTMFQADYALNRQGKFALRAGMNFNNYGDKFNSLNDFKQFNVVSGIDFIISPKTDLHLDYSFLSNNLKQDETNNYTQHRILAAANMKINPLSRFNLQLRSAFETSASAFHKFSNIEPAVTYEKLGENSRLQLRLAYEILSYGDLELKNYGRLDLRIGANRRRGNSSRSGDLQFQYKSFPDNNLASFMQFKGRYSASSSGRLNKLFAVTLFTNFYSGNSTANYSDLRLDLGRVSATFFNDTSLYFRLWHSPVQGTTNKVYKSHVIDIYEKLGFNLGNFRIGPVIGAHLLVSSETGVNFLKRDGNVLRFGAMAEGRLSLPLHGNLNLSAAYEYGFVYSEEIAVDSGTGQLTIGDVDQRHPTTFQFNATVSIPVSKSFECLGQINYYKIATDMDTALSINPVTQNSRFVLLFGLRYKYN